MKYTDKELSMEKAYVGKLNLMISRMTGKGTDDNILAVDGDEGQGKTEFAAGTCYYVSYMTGRPYSVDNIFFDLDEGIKFASMTKDQIIHLDEGALGLLRTQWQNKTQQKFLQLVMTARKKRHFIIICIPKFHRLPQYVIEERVIGLAHIYSRRNLQKGRFCYYTKAAKDHLFQDWERKKIKNYKKYYVLRGTFPKVMEKIFSKKQLQQYEDKKDAAIMSINNPPKKDEVAESVRKNIEVKTKIPIAKKLIEMFPNETKVTLAKAFGVSTTQFTRYLEAKENENPENPPNAHTLPLTLYKGKDKVLPSKNILNPKTQPI